MITEEEKRAVAEFSAESEAAPDVGTLTQQLLELRAERDQARQQLAAATLAARNDSDLYFRMWHARISTVEAYEQEAKLAREWIANAEPIVKTFRLIVDAHPALADEQDLYLWAMGQLRGEPVVLQPRHGRSRRSNPLLHGVKRNLSHADKTGGQNG